MTTDEVREKYLKFFERRGHKRIDPAPLVLENDSTLFTPFGMQQLVPYLMGKKHPKGTRLVNSQPSIRLDDIEEVGDNRHTTFFEMLGNWSLGDYFKKDQLHWLFKFLTDKKEGLGLDPKKLYVTVFDGDENFKVHKNGKYQELTPDVETIALWKEIFKEAGIDAKEGERIQAYSAKKNWWSVSGTPNQMSVGEIGGPDSEIFYKFSDVEHDFAYGKHCHINCDCGRFLEIGNSVFMQYKKIDERTFEELPNKNVDFGGGLERLTAAANNDPDVFRIDLLWPLIDKISQIAGAGYKGNENHFRVMADHTRAATFLASEGVPAASDDRHGSVLRRLIDRVVEEGRKLGINKKFLLQLSEIVISNYKNSYRLLFEKSEEIQNTLSSAESRIREISVSPSTEAPPEAIENLPNMEEDEILIEMRKDYGKLFDNQSFEQYIKDSNYTSLPSTYAGTLAFKAKTTEGYPISSVEEEARNALLDNFEVDDFYKSYNDYLEQHKKISQKAGKKLFKGGLGDHSEQTTRLHTTTHLLHASLRKILGDHVQQKGSNITAERLRFDFSHPQKLTDGEIKKVEDLINEQIKKDLPITFETMTFKEAKNKGALAFFAGKYGEKVKVYTIGSSYSKLGSKPFSREVCGGPHVKSTSEIGRVRIKKQEKIGSGLIRVYAVVE